MGGKDRKTSVFGPDAATAGNSPLAVLAALKGSLPEGGEPEPEPRAQPVGQTGKIVVCRERKGRGGKTVTLVRGLALDAEALATLARELRQQLGTGGSVEDATIVLNGDQTLRVAELLMNRGYKRIIVP